MKEYLLENLLDKEFQRMLFPLNLMQTVLLQTKYRIVSGFITPIDSRGLLKWFLGVIIILSANLLKLYSYKFDDTLDRLDCVTTLNIFDTAFYSMSSLIMLIVNFSQSQNNVQFILKLQNVYRVVNSTNSLKRFGNYNWMNIVITILILLLFLCVNYGRDFTQILFVTTLFYFDGNIIFAIQIMNFLKHEIKMWTCALDRFYVTCTEPNHNKLTKYLMETEQQEKRLFDAYLDIMEAFKLYKYIFQYTILQLAIENFVHPLVYIQNFLTTIPSSDLPLATHIFYGLVSSLWVVKNFTLLVVLCVSCQQFYLAVQEVDKKGAVLIGYHSSLYILNIQKLCKNVLRVNACSVGGRGLRAGGALAVDAALPLRLLALLATYTVVLLQFAFL